MAVSRTGPRMQMAAAVLASPAIVPPGRHGLAMPPASPNPRQCRRLPGQPLRSNPVVPRMTVRTGAAVPPELPSPSRSRAAWCDLSPDGRFLIAAEVDPERNPPDRVCCHSLADLKSSLWAIDTNRPVHSSPLFLAGGERFVLFEWRG